MKTNKVITILLFLLGVTGLKAQNTNIDAYVKKMVVLFALMTLITGISVVISLTIIMVITKKRKFLHLLH